MRASFLFLTLAKKARGCLTQANSPTLNSIDLHPCSSASFLLASAAFSMPSLAMAKDTSMRRIASQAQFSLYNLRFSPPVQSKDGSWGSAKYVRKKGLAFVALRTVVLYDSATSGKYASQQTLSGCSRVTVSSLINSLLNDSAALFVCGW